MKDGRVAAATTSGSGFKKMDSTTLFRAANFELFMDPAKRGNRILGIVGSVVMVGACAYAYVEINRATKERLEREKREEREKRRERKRKKKLLQQQRQE